MNYWENDQIRLRGVQATDAPSFWGWNQDSEMARHLDFLWPPTSLESVQAWAEKHQAVIVSIGGPLGKTKRVDARGIADTSNEMSAFSIVRAESHEAAAKLFEQHPHFMIFPGDAVEIMPILPIPGA